MNHLLDPNPEFLKRWLTERAEPAFRATQIHRWIYGGRANSFEDMTDLSKDLRTALAENFVLWTGQVVKHKQTEDGTEKLLIQWPDQHQIECVLLRDGDRRTICISTQVGCAMGCVFCASGLDGVARNLTSGEIVEQVLQLDRLLPAEETTEPYCGNGHGRATGQSRSAATGACRSVEPGGTWHQCSADYDFDRWPAFGDGSIDRREGSLQSGSLTACAR